MTDTEEDYDEYDEGMDADYYMDITNDTLDSQQQFNWHMSMILEGYIYGQEQYIRNHDLRVRRRTVATPTVAQLERFFGNIEIVEGMVATRSSYPYNHVDWQRTTTLRNILWMDGGALTALWDDRIQKVTVRGYEDYNAGEFYRFDFDNDWIYANPDQNTLIEIAINRMEDWNIGDAFNEVMESEGLLDASNEGGMAFNPLEGDVGVVDNIEHFREELMIGLYYEFENRGGEGFDEGDFRQSSDEEREAVIPNFNERTEQLYTWWQEQHDEDGSIPGTDANNRDVRNILLLGNFPSGFQRPAARRRGRGRIGLIFPDGEPTFSAGPFGDEDTILDNLQEEFDDFMDNFNDSLLRAKVYGFWRGLNMKPTFKYANYDDWNSKKVKLIGGYSYVSGAYDNKPPQERLNIILFNRLFEFYDDCYKRKPGACRTHRSQFDSLRSQLKGVNDIYVMNTTVVPQEVLRPTHSNLEQFISALDPSVRAPRIREEASIRRVEAEDDESPVAETEAEPEPTVDRGNMVDALFNRAFEEDGADAAFLRERYARNLAAFNALNLGE